MLKLLWISFVIFVLASSVHGLGCYKPPPKAYSVVLSPLPHEKLGENDVPAEIDWRLHNGTCFTTKVYNQFQPKACGSCWAVNSMGALSDRFKISTKGLVTDINLAPQVLLDCGISEGAGSCDGGSDVLAYKYVHEHGITDDSCLPYLATDYSQWGELSCDNMMCRTCDRFGTCKFIQNVTKYTVSEYGTVRGEQQMKAEIFARGPIACSLWAHSSSFEDYTGGIIEDSATYAGTTHVVSIVGYGEENGIPYWIGRNSFGTFWGEKGFFRLRRGNNTLNIETHDCAWAVPHPQSILAMLN